MKYCVWLVLLVCLPVLCYTQASDYDPVSNSPVAAPSGGSGSLGSDAQAGKNWEQELTKIDPLRFADHIEYLTKNVRLFGTPIQRETAEYVQRELQSYGFETAEVVSFNSVFPRNNTKSLSIVSGGNTDYVFTFKEPDLPDAPAADPGLYDPFITYSGEGSITASVVYVNYGRQSDYKLLQTLQVNVTGLIVIARLGYLDIDQKVANAQMYRAAGILLYADPLDDGYTQGDVYPAGPFRPSSASFSGQTKFNALCPGSSRAEHIAVCRGTQKYFEPLPTIPVLPLSADDANQILRSLSGPAASTLDRWQGGLPFQYHTGPGPVTVAMSVFTESRYIYVTGYNVIATLFKQSELIHGGSSESFDVTTFVGIGSHRDSWTSGGLPAAGTATVLEIARVFGKLKSSGWKARRNIKIFSWDGGELGQVGSIYWVERNPDLINKSMIAYLDIDKATKSAPSPRSSGRVRWSASISGSLRSVVKQATAKVRNPIGNSGYLNDSGYTFERPGKAQTDAIGFWNHAGVAGMESSYVWNLTTPVNQFGVYPGVWNSRWDDSTAITSYYDPAGDYEKSLVHLYGWITYSLVYNIVIPFDYQGTYDQIKSDLVIIDPLLRSSAVWSSDSHSTKVQSGWSGVNSAVAGFLTAVQTVQLEIDEWKNRIGLDPEGIEINSIDYLSIQALNKRLMITERAFLSQEGLPLRPWYKNMMFAVDLKNESKTVGLPGITDSLWDKDYSKLVEQLAEFQQRMNVAEQYLRYGEGGSNNWTDKASTNVVVIVVLVIVGAILLLGICIVLICCVVRNNRNKVARPLN